MEQEPTEQRLAERDTKPMRPVKPAGRVIKPNAAFHAAPASSSNRGNCLLWTFAVGGVTLALASLVLSGFLFLELRKAGKVTGGVLDEAIASIDAIPRERIEYSVPISQTIQFSSTIPFSGDLEIPFKQSVTINRTVRVLVSAGILGQIPIDIPIYATIPIDLNVPVSIDQEFPVEAEIPLKLEVPVTVDPEQWGVSGVLLTIRRWLAAIRELM
jgi:hypothetical protein